MTTSAPLVHRENSYAVPEIGPHLEVQPEKIPARLLASYITGPLGIVFGLTSLMVHLASRGTLVGFGLVYSLMFLFGVSCGASGLALALGYKRTSWEIVGRRGIRISIAISLAALLISLVAGFFVMQALFNR